MNAAGNEIAMVQRAAATWTALVESIDDSQWQNPTPCEGWTVRDLLVHVIERDRGLVAQFEGEPRDHNRFRRAMAGERITLASDDDLVLEWRNQWAWWQVRLNDPSSSDDVRPTPVGDVTFVAAAAILNTLELTVHAWDLARALGTDDTIDPELVKVCLQRAESLDRDRLPQGLFAPALDAETAASAQDRLLALVGRTPPPTSAG